MAFFVLLVIGFTIKYWYIVIPVALVVTVLAVKSSSKAKQRREAEYQAWLAGPPPPLDFPGRFTPTWFKNHGPYLHPGQVPMVLQELRRRGWNESDIQARALPYLPNET